MVATSSVCAGALRDGRRRRSRLVRLSVVLVFAGALVFTGLATAQTAPASPGTGVPFARYVPESAGLFIAVRGLGEFNSALDRTRAWHLLPLFSNASPTGTGEPFNLRDAIVEFLGPNVSVDVDELMRLDAGLVASSWSALGSAVWLVRAPDEKAVDRWFPEEGRVSAGAVRSLRCFRTKDGMIVCSHDTTVAMSRRWTGGSLMRETMGVMDGNAAGVLERSKTFKDLMSPLRPGYLALAYWTADDATKPPRGGPSLWWPANDQTLIALYEGEGRIDVAVRGSLTTPRKRPRLSSAAVDRLLRLPRTTLYAATTTIDLDNAYNAATANPEPTILRRYLTLLRGIQRGISSNSERDLKFGPHVIFVWGQDLTEDGLSPQVAFMIQCSDETAGRDYATQFAKRVMRLFRLTDPAKGPEPIQINETRHLGVSMSHVSLAAHADAARLPLMKLLGGLEPAWAVSDGWLIVALNRAHLEDILEAQSGLTPTLAGVRDVHALRGPSIPWGVLSVAQASLAADVLVGWVAAHKDGAPSLLDPSWWSSQRPSATSSRAQLGVGMQIVQEPGVAVVTTVQPHTPADGRLNAGDRIVGIDGRLLSLESPNADLRKRWFASKVESGPKLRVLRDGKIIEVAVPREIALADPSDNALKPADAVRELASLAKALRFASFAVQSTDENHYSARLSLRFAPAQVSNSSDDQ